MLSTTTSRRVIAAFVAAGWLSPALAAEPALAQGVPFERLGTTFVETHCGTSVSAETCDLEELLARDFVRLRLGAIELESKVRDVPHPNPPAQLTP